MIVEPEPVAVPTSGKDILGHPRGLATLAGTELWERISFHGMVALLTLYMAEQLLLPGHIEKIVGFAAYRRVLQWITGPLTIEALATQTFGLYIGLIYFTPVLGGLIGDRLLGRRNAVILGCVLMTLGHFCMAFDQSFLFALLLLTLGAGFLRGNLIAQVGALYRSGDARSTHAMSPAPSARAMAGTMGLDLQASACWWVWLFTWSARQTFLRERHDERW